MSDTKSDTQPTALWGGVFEKTLNPAIHDFNASLRFDHRLVWVDIAGSTAHAAMLGQQGIISPQQADALVAGLKQLQEDLASGKTSLPTEAEDIHSAIEQLLTERLGEVGKTLHTGRSRNDQVATDLRLYTRQALHGIQNDVKQLMQTLCKIAARHTHSLMPGYTHLQAAQPITLAHHLLAYVEMLTRDHERLRDTINRLNYSPLGAGALATSTYPIDRHATAKALGFSGICTNSLDAVSDRDFVVEALSALSMIMMHLSRLSEELILWCNPQYGFMQLDDAYSTGSSMMPQKKNPDIAELARGKTGRVYGHLLGMLTTLKGLPLAYNKDMQEDKEALFDSLDTTAACLSCLNGMLASAIWNTHRMAQAAQTGYLNATDLADYLVKQGMPFREAHHVTGLVVQAALQQQKPLEQLSLETLQQFSPLFQATVFDALNLHTCLEQRNIAGGPAPLTVQAQLSYWQNNWLQELERHP